MIQEKEHTMMSKNGKTSLLFVVMVVLLALATAAASSATGTRAVNTCVVKFVCGETGEGTGERVVSGTYRTSINILNPSSSQAVYSKRIALTTPCIDDVPEQPGDRSNPIEGVVGGGLAFDVDCSEIPSEFTFGDDPPGPLCQGSAPSLVEGFLILTSSKPLTVSAVYTSGEDGDSSFEVDSVHCTSSKSGGGDDDDDDGGGGDDDDDD
jgi:hypothetical protein